MVKKHIIGFFKDAIQSFDIDSGAVRVSIVLIGDDAKTQFHLNQVTKKKKLLKALRSIKAKQYRAKKASLINLMTTLKSDVLIEANGDRPDVPNIVVVINDIETKDDVNQMLRLSSDFKQGNDRIVAIGVESSSPTEMGALGQGYSDTHYYNGDKYDYLTKSTDLRTSLANSFKICKFQSIYNNLFEIDT